MLALLAFALPSPAAAQLAGDCDLSGAVSDAEITMLFQIAFGLRPLTDCDEGDLDMDGAISVDEIVAAVNAKLCGGVCPTPTPSPTPPPTFTPTPSPVPLGACGNGVLEPSEQCDPPFDSACPGQCRLTAAPPPECIVCGTATAACNGPADPTCAGQCVTTSAACTCAPNPPAVCPAPGPSSRFECPIGCAQVGARLFYREEIVGNTTYFAEREVVLTGFPDPAQPNRISVHVRQTSNDGSTEFDTMLDFSNASGGIGTPAGAAGTFGSLYVYRQLVCGTPIACTAEGVAVIPNGTTYDFKLGVGFGQTDRFVFSCAGCGGGPERVNAIWKGARCGLAVFSQRQLLCAGDNLINASVAPRCCDCPADACPASAPMCVDEVCQ